MKSSKPDMVNHPPHYQPDMVNHPPHYQMGRFEVIDILEDLCPDDPLIWQVMKYCARYKHKGNPLQDLKKARWYLDRKISKMEKK